LGRKDVEEGKGEPWMYLTKLAGSLRTKRGGTPHELQRDPRTSDKTRKEVTKMNMIEEGRNPSTYLNLGCTLSNRVYPRTQKSK